MVESVATGLSRSGGALASREARALRQPEGSCQGSGEVVQTRGRVACAGLACARVAGRRLRLRRRVSFRGAVQSSYRRRRATMRMFSLGAVSRAIAHGITAAVVCSAALLALGATPAGAQISAVGGGGSTRASTTQSVAMVPFENRSGYRSETFGQEASDAVATELRDRLNLDVLPKADTEMWLRNLGYKPPFSDQELSRLATELEVNMVMSGQIRSARVVQSRDGRYGEVTLAVVLFDRLAQADTNGALVSARGPASTEASDETLITKALQQAAFDATQQMRTRPT